MRNTMRGTVGNGNGSMLSKNNLIRSSKTQPAPIRRSDSERIETWRDEVRSCCSSGNVTPDLDEKEHTGRLSKFTKRLRTKTNESLGSGKGSGEFSTTLMYDGSKEGETWQDDWQDGAGDSMYQNSVNSECGRVNHADGRLDRAEQLLGRGCGDDEKKVHEEVKGVQRATA